MTYYAIFLQKVATGLINFKIACEVPTHIHSPLQEYRLHHLPYILHVIDNCGREDIILFTLSVKRNITF